MSNAKITKIKINGRIYTMAGDSAVGKGTGENSAQQKGCTASGKNSCAFGYDTQATGEGAFAEGGKSVAEGAGAHSEGSSTEAIGDRAHAEGNKTRAIGHVSHAEGQNTSAIGIISHTEGEGTIASSRAQHSQGKFNIEDVDGKYAHIVGNGEDDERRSNAHTIDWEGNAWFAGSLSLGSTLLSQKRLNALLSLITETISGVYLIPDFWDASDGEMSGVTFTSNGETFSRMRIVVTPHETNGNKNHLYYDDKLVAEGWGAFIFLNDSYKTVDFGEKTQELLNVEYSWFTSFATQKGEEPSDTENTVSGVWRLTSNLSSNEETLSQAVNFAVNGTSYSNFFVEYQESMASSNIYYDDIKVHNAVFQGWEIEYEDIAYRTLDFGSTPQTVSAEFKQWLNNYATEGGKEPSDTENTVSGVWMFTFDNGDQPICLNQDVSFTSNGTQYNSMSVEYNDAMAQFDINYDNENAYNCVQFAWIEESYKTIDFGSTPQTVSAEFKQWLTANATKQ